MVFIICRCMDKSGSYQKQSLHLLHNHKSCFHTFPSVRSSCGSRTWSGFTWICSAAAATWPVCRAASPPTPNACWASPHVPPSWPWADWASSPFPPSMRWYDCKCPHTHLHSCTHLSNTRDWPLIPTLSVNFTLRSNRTCLVQNSNSCRTCMDMFQ